jgi:hypothetical protein
MTLFRIVAIPAMSIKPVVFDAPLTPVDHDEFPGFSHRAALIRKDPEDDNRAKPVLVAHSVKKKNTQPRAQSPTRAQRRQSAAVLSLGTHNAEFTAQERHYLGYEQTPLSLGTDHTYNRTSNSAIRPLIKMLNRQYPMPGSASTSFVFSWDNLTYMDSKVFGTLCNDSAFSARFVVRETLPIQRDLGPRFWTAYEACQIARSNGTCAAEQLIVFQITNRVVALFAFKPGSEKPSIGSYASKLGLSPPTRLGVGKELLRLYHHCYPESSFVSFSRMLSEFTPVLPNLGGSRYQWTYPKPVKAASAQKSKKSGPVAVPVADVPEVPQGLSWIKDVRENLEVVLRGHKLDVEPPLKKGPNLEKLGPLEVYIQTAYAVRNEMERLLLHFHLEGKKVRPSFAPIMISDVATITPKLTTYGMTCISSVFLDFQKRLAKIPLQVLMSETGYFEYRSLITDHLLPGFQPETFMEAQPRPGSAVFLFTESMPNSTESRLSNFSETFAATIKSLRGPTHLVLIDATLSEFNDPEFSELLQMIRPFALQEKFQVVVMQSLAKYFHFGTDLFPGGLFGVCRFNTLAEPETSGLEAGASQKSEASQMEGAELVIVAGKKNLFGAKNRAARVAKRAPVPIAATVPEDHTEDVLCFDPEPLVGMKRAYQKMVHFLLTPEMVALRQAYMGIIRENTRLLHASFCASGVASPNFQIKEILPGQPYIMIQARVSSSRLSELKSTIQQGIFHHNLPLTQRQSIGFNLSALTWFPIDEAEDSSGMRQICFRWVVGAEPLHAKVCDRNKHESALLAAYTQFVTTLKDKLLPSTGSREVR